MSIDIAAVRDGLANALAVLNVQVATAPDQVTPPCAIVGMPTVRYHQSMARGLDVSEWPVTMVTPRTHDEAAVAQHDAWLLGVGDGSVLSAIEADRSLDGACATLVVREARPTTWQEMPAMTFTVEVWS